MYKTVSSMLARSGNIIHPYLMGGKSQKKAVVVITSNRGLAGGYNADVVKLVTGSDLQEDVEIYAIGHKGREALERRGYMIREDASEIIESPAFTDAADICKKMLDSYVAGEIGEIYLAYTHFKNTVVHEPKLMKLLPVDVSEVQVDSEDSNILMNYEPNEEGSSHDYSKIYHKSVLWAAL